MRADGDLKSLCVVACQLDVTSMTRVNRINRQNVKLLLRRQDMPVIRMGRLLPGCGAEFEILHD